MSGRWLLDTCVLSEFARARPNAHVADRLAAADESTLASSVLTLAAMHSKPESTPRYPRACATAIAHGHAVATRNERDCVDFEVPIVNRWQPQDPARGQSARRRLGSREEIVTRATPR